MDADRPPSRTAIAAARHRPAHQLLAAVASLGEPWVSDFSGEALEALLLTSGLDDVRRAEAAPVILERLSLPPSPERGRTRLAPATTGWAQTERS